MERRRIAPAGVFVSAFPVNSISLGRFSAIKRVWLSAAMAITVLPVSSPAADGGWTAAAGGNWSAPSNWAGGVVANGATSTANFPGDISTVESVTLDTTRTIGNLSFSGQGAPGKYWSIDGGNVLTLDNGVATPTISTTTGATISVVVGGTSGFNKLGAESLILTGSNTYSGTTTISAGTLQVDGVGGTLGTSNVVDNATLVLHRDQDYIVSNAISGIGKLLQIQSFSILTGSNSYSGTTTISGGSLRIGNGGTTGTLGTGDVLNNAELAFNRSDAITVNNDISGIGSFKKLGAGKTTLSGANSFTGESQVFEGTLALAGSGSLAHSPTIDLQNGTSLDVSGVTGGENFNGTRFTLAHGQTLTGGGQVLGAMNIGTGAAIAPRNLLTTQSLSLSGNATYDAAIDTNRGGSDLLYVQGDLALDLAETAQLSLRDLGNAKIAVGDGFTLINYTGGWNGGTFAGLPEDSLFSLGPNIFRINYNEDTGKYRALTLTAAAPEPASGTLLVFVVAGAALLRRRR